MKKNYIAPLCEDVKMSNLMVDFLGIASTSAGVQSVSGKQGA